jgi:Tol biopolymer transport system component
VLDNESNWAPDGKRVIFTRSTGSADGVNEAHQLVIVGGGGGPETAVTPGRPASDSVVPGWDDGADFSPDGRHIAYVHSWGTRDPLQHSDVYIADANGKHARRVTHFAGNSGTTGTPRWSPDGKRLVFVRTASGLGPGSEPPGGQALFLVDADGTHLHELTPWPAMAGGVPDWSRATNLIAFRSAPEESGIGNVFSIRPDGSGLTQVTHLHDTLISHQVGFSPDGRWLLFSQRTGTHSGDLSVVAIDGSRMRAIVHSRVGIGNADWVG